MVLLSDEEILNQTNNILNHCELQPRFCSVHDIQDNASSICVAILERLLHQKLPGLAFFLFNSLHTKAIQKYRYQS